MVPPIHLGAWSMALMLWLPFELLLLLLLSGRCHIPQCCIYIILPLPPSLPPSLPLYISSLLPLPPSPGPPPSSLPLSLLPPRCHIPQCCIYIIHSILYILPLPPSLPPSPYISPPSFPSLPPPDPLPPPPTLSHTAVLYIHYIIYTPSPSLPPSLPLYISSLLPLPPSPGPPPSSLPLPPPPPPPCSSNGPGCEDEGSHDWSHFPHCKPLLIVSACNTSLCELARP